MSARMGSVRRVLTEPGTPYARLALAGMLGLAAAAATIGLLAGSGYVVGRAMASGSSATTRRCARSPAGGSGSTTA